jgi:hypothetical protein
MMELLDLINFISWEMSNSDKIELFENLRDLESNARIKGAYDDVLEVMECEYLPDESIGQIMGSL